MFRFFLFAVLIAATLPAPNLPLGDAARASHWKEVRVIDPASGLEVDMTTTGVSGAEGAEKKANEGTPKGAVVAPSKVDTKVSGDKPAEAAPISGQELLSEIAILQKLSERRKKLEEMERQIKMREDLLTASEGRIGSRIEELKSLEDRIGTAEKSKEDAKRKEVADLAKV